MIKPKKYLKNVLGADLAQDLLWSPSSITAVSVDGHDLVFTAALGRKKPLSGGMYFDQDIPDGELYFRARFYSGEILRLQITGGPQSFVDESPMLTWDPALQPRPVRLQADEGGWLATDGGAAWLRLSPTPVAPQASPDGQVVVAFQGEDQFFAHMPDALPALRLKRSNGAFLTGCAFKVQPGEHFCGTGERFARPDLFGQQIDLVNVDAAGVNNARAYKNIPFLLSSRDYGLFVHSAAKMRLDIGAHSTRSLQWIVEDEFLDIFIIGGGSLARVLRNYQRLTGVPPRLPTWSFGVWMGRSSYFSDQEASQVASRLREEDYPADVIHLDTGWFTKDWVCDWTFSPQNFPNPAGFMQRLERQGFKVSLWQYPYIHRETELAKTALAKGYVGKETAPGSGHWLGYTLDFTRSGTAGWYSGLLQPLLEAGAAVIKADFGEEVDETAIYANTTGSKYHNLFALLYQQVVWDTTRRIKGEGNTLIWARSAWSGCQRYPVHWGGDAASTYDGLAGSLMGGLHFGLSGFAYWSHDVGGIHGIPDYARTPPSDDLYVRWTQFGVFTSHMRYHGGTPREPWAFPAVAPLVRQWLRFRYALLPYILDQAEQCRLSGLPMLRSLVIDWPDDPAVWSLPDEYLFGEAFLVCPVISPSGERDVYLPKGDWVDFWSGQMRSGPQLLTGVRSTLAILPLFVRKGSWVEFAEPFSRTGLLAGAQRVSICFDESYPGFDGSPLRQWIQFDPPEST